MGGIQDSTPPFWALYGYDEEMGVTAKELIVELVKQKRMDCM